MQIRKIFLGTTAVVALMVTTAAVAAPSTYTVAAGDATVATDGLVTTVTQTSDRSVIEWNGFNLATTETVNFVVPAVTSATLNRIVDGSGTTISGMITSNGVVYFVNPNGLVFDATSQVQAQGFVAFSGAISDTDFMTKSYSALDLTSRGTGAISLNGNITLPQINGFVGPTLVAAHGGSVAVGGAITVARGNLSLVSTTATTIGQDAVIQASDNGYAVAGTISLSSEQAVTVEGSLAADRGNLQITAPTVTVSGSLSARFGEVRLQSTTKTSLSSTANLSATVDQFGQNGLISVASDAELELGGTLTATRGRIVGTGATVTVSGNLYARNGTIQLSSSLGTTVDAAGVLSVDADIMGNIGGTVTIVAGETVSVAGTITARGNDQRGLGGTIKLAGKTGLSLTGMLDSSAATGSLGSLQLGAATVEIGSGSTAGVTYVTAEKLRQLSAKNNLVIDTGLAQPADDQGAVTVNEAVELTSSLSLIGRSLTINQSLKTGGDLILRQVGTTAGDGITVTGVGLTAGRDLTLDQSGTVGSGKAGIVLSGSGVALAAGGLARNWIVLRARSTTGILLLGSERFDLNTAMVRLDLGTGAMVSESGQNRSLNLSNLAVFYSGARSGNSATLLIGRGSLTVMLDRQSHTAPLQLNDQSLLSDLGWSDDQGFVESQTPNPTPGLNSFERGGLTVVSRGGIDSVNQIGLSSGGTVEISGIKTGDLARLSLIEARGISLTSASEFAHSLTLIANGTGVSTATGVFGISLQADLRIGQVDDRVSTLTLLQSGEVFGTGIRMSGVKIVVGGSLNSQQNRSFFGTGLEASKTTLTIGKDLSLWQSADFFVDGMVLHKVTATVAGDILISQNADSTRYHLVSGQSFEIQNSELTAGGRVTIERGGGTINNGLRFDTVKIKSGGSVVIRQTGAAELNGILMRELDIHSGQDLSIHQSGTVGEGYSGIRFEAVPWETKKDAWGITFFGGSTALNWITLSVRAKIGLTLAGFDNFDFNTAQVRIDLGTGTMVSEFPPPVVTTPIPTPPTLPVLTPAPAPAPAPVIPKAYSLNLFGLTVYYTGATTGNQARLVMNSGEFVFVTDRRAQTATVVLDNQLARGNTSSGWGVGLGFVASNLNETEYSTYINASGLKVKTYGALSSVTKMGLALGGDVDIQGLDAIAEGSNLRYIEGARVKVSTTASRFTDSIVLVANGAVPADTSPGILVTVNLAAGVEGEKNNSILTLINRNDQAGNGIQVSGVSLSNTRTITLLQQGAVSGTGILLETGASLQANQNLNLIQTGSSGGDGIALNNAVLSGDNGLILSSTGSRGGAGISVTNSSLKSKQRLELATTGESAAAGISLSDTTVDSGGQITLSQTGLVGDGHYGIEFHASTATEAEKTGKGFGILLTVGEPSGSLTLKSRAALAVGLQGEQNFIVKNGTVNLDLGEGAIQSFGNPPGTVLALEARNQRLLVIGNSTQNSVKFILDDGSFTRIVDQSSNTKPIVIDDQTQDSAWGGSNRQWTTNSDQSHTNGGITVVTTRLGSWDNFGVIFGGSVEIKNLTSNGAASNLNYIQAAGILVTGPSQFNHQLTLNSTGHVMNSTITETKSGTVSIAIISDLKVGLTGDGLSSLSLWNNATDSSYGILVRNSTLTVGGSVEALNNRSALSGISVRNTKFVGGGDLKLFSFGGNQISGININDSTLTVAKDLMINESKSSATIALWLADSKITVGRDLSVTKSGDGFYSTAIWFDTLNLTAGRDILLEQSGYATNPIKIEASTLSAGRDLVTTVAGSGFYPSFQSSSSTFTAGRDITVVAEGLSYYHSLFIETTTAHAGNNLSLTQSETARSSKSGLLIANSSLSADADLSLLQLGEVNYDSDGNWGGIELYGKSGDVVGAVNLRGGQKDLSWIRLKSNGAVGIALHGSDNFYLSNGRVRIDLQGAIGTGRDINRPSATINAQGLDVFFNAATSTSTKSDNNVIFNIGSGIFVRMIDRRVSTLPVTLSNNPVSVPQTTYWGVQILSTTITPTVSYYGLVYSTAVTIDGFQFRTSDNQPIVYVEGKSITVQNSSRSTNSVVLMTSGGNLTMAGSLDFNRALYIGTHGGAFSLLSPVATTGGVVAINLDTGGFSNRRDTVVGGVTTPVFAQWQIGTDSRRNPLYLYGGSWDGESTDGAFCFSQVSSVSVGGTMVLTRTLVTDESAAQVGFISPTPRTVHYFTSLGYSTDEDSAFARAARQLADLDSDSVLHPLGDALITPNETTTISAGFSFDQRTGRLSWTTAKVFSDQNHGQLPQNLGFYRSTGRPIPVIHFAPQTRLVLAGVNSFGAGVDWSEQTISSLTLLAGSRNYGTLLLPSSPADFEVKIAKGSLPPNLTRSSSLTLVLGDDFWQGEILLSTELVKLRNQNLYNLYLNNPNNGFSRLSGTTLGGSVLAITQAGLDISGLDTAGGSVQIRSGQSISGREFYVGSLSFKAVGQVVLESWYAGASGSAASIRLQNRSAGSVVGGLNAEGNLSLGSRGLTILNGDIVSNGGGTVEIESPVVIYRSLDIGSATGGISLPAQMSSWLNGATIHLRLFDGSRGLNNRFDQSSDLHHLGWVEFNSWF